jgi:hypothetical protein
MRYLYEEIPDQVAYARPMQSTNYLSSDGLGRLEVASEKPAASLFRVGQRVCRDHGKRPKVPQQQSLPFSARDASGFVTTVQGCPFDGPPPQLRAGLWIDSIGEVRR